MASNTWASGESLRITLLEFAFGLPGIYSCALPQQLRSQNATLRYDLLWIRHRQFLDAIFCKDIVPPCLEVCFFRILDTAFVSWSLCVSLCGARFGSICSSSIQCQPQRSRLKEFQFWKQIQWLWARNLWSLGPTGQHPKTSKNGLKKLETDQSYPLLCLATPTLQIQHLSSKFFKGPVQPSEINREN